MMTPRQRQALEFIGREIAVKGVSPSYDEVKSALGIKSTSHAFLIVGALVGRGLMTKINCRDRSFDITDKGWSALRTGSTCPCCGAPMKGGA